MRGFPKRISTAQDIEHCFELVQAGELDAAQFQEALEAIGRRAFLNVPIVDISADRRTVTTRFCNEAIAGAAGSVVITNIQHQTDPGAAGGIDEGSFAFTVLTLQSALPAGVDVLEIPAPVAPFIEMGIAPARFTAMQGIIEPLAMKGAIQP